MHAPGFAQTICSALAGCDYVSVEKANKQHLNPILARLVKTPFFRYFKVNLWCDCSFWPDDSMCVLRDCSVCECADEEVPSLWKTAEDSCKGVTCSYKLQQCVLARSNLTEKSCIR